MRKISIKFKKPTKEKSDSEIIDFIKSSDESLNNKAFFILYKQNYESIKSYVLNNNGTEEDAKDIFQDSLIVFYKKIKTSDLYLNCAIKTYMYSVCKNKWLDRLRATKNRNRILKEGFVQESEEYIEDKEIENKERKETLNKILNLLGSDCKKILYYYYYDRISMKDIAEKMGYAGEQSAKNKKLKCLNYLRKRLNPELLSEII